MSITLDYFDIRGFGEYIRLLLADQKIQFTDNQFGRDSKTWEELKKTMPFGQVPCLTIGNEKFVQTGAIMRHLGRLYNLYGSSLSEAVHIDTMFECVRDFRMKYVRYIYYDEETKEQYDTVTLPDGLGKLSRLLTGDYVGGDKISFADYILFEELDVSNTSCPGSLDKFVNLKNFHKRMLERPNIKAYLPTRNPRINVVDKF